MRDPAASRIVPREAAIAALGWSGHKPPVTPIDPGETGLQHSLTKAQITMIGLGGAIGTGLFLGSGIAIGYAGPGVLLSYAIAAFLALVVGFSLSEMAIVHPAAGSFGVYAERYLSPLVGFVVRWTYWLAQVIAIGGEAVAAGVYMGFWFPGVPVWLWSIGFSALLLWFNARSVGDFGSIEYWLAFVKVVAIVLFILLGLSAVLGVGQPAVGFHNLTGLPGGFLPHGLGGVWMGVLIGIFSFVGVEVIAVTSGEAQDPARAIPAALKTMVVRLFMFYILALGIVVAFVPWTETGAEVVSKSPFVKVFQYVGIPYAAGITNFVVVTAALSSMNTNIYLCSRMLFSLSRGGYAPDALGRLNGRGSPVAAILFSGAFILLAAGLSRLTPLAYNYLFGISIFGAIVVWMVVLASHLRFRRAHAEERLPVRTPFFPWLQIAGLALLGAILVTMAFDGGFWRVAWIVGAPCLVLAGAAYAVVQRRRAGVAVA
jgi:L-asparagine transporter-like permease